MKQVISKSKFFVLSTLLTIIAITVSAFNDKKPQDTVGSLTAAESWDGAAAVLTCTTSDPQATPERACNVTADTTTTTTTTGELNSYVEIGFILFQTANNTTTI